MFEMFGLNKIMLFQTKLGKSTRKYTVDGRELTFGLENKVKGRVQEDSRLQNEVGGYQYKESGSGDKPTLRYNPESSRFEEISNDSSRYSITIYLLI